MAVSRGHRHGYHVIAWKALQPIVGGSTAYLGDEDDLGILNVLLEKRVGNVEAADRPSEDHDGFRHFAMF